ncbi:transporter substrate-binding domain-containing protein [Methylomonas sp. LL1]|uniref:transporter substrate-binding domain-containing protein n=1 Tax=Methylomonas sp. LL1 TaxID=2785785 RepID=UPI0018C372B4|nr:transporter substrate-binding domain-containing protein [Methylomonas sp. LL1]QPK65045.1 transporter substrate-binding domain-containing protein [Methylomonas sp. LL1]
MFSPRFFYRLLSCLAALILWSSHASGKEALTWGVLNFPPFQILEGSRQGSGSFDGELQRLIARMPEYAHDVVPMSFARRREDFIAGANLCTPGIFKPPAQALNLAISMPALTHLDNRIVFLKDKAKLFGEDNPIALDTLFSNEKLVGAVVPGRSYAPNIDEAIQRFRGKPNLMIRPLETRQLFEMLLNGDLDYLILFSHEAAFLADQSGGSELIMNRPIAGTPPYLYTHVACTGNAWGQAIIAKINAILLSEREQAQYRSYSERWYPIEDREKVRGYYPNMLKELK